MILEYLSHQLLDVKKLLEMKKSGRLKQYSARLFPNSTMKRDVLTVSDDESQLIVLNQTTPCIP